MIIESFNITAAYAALDEPFIETRICVTIRPEAETFRFVKDTLGHSLNGWDFNPVVYAEFSPITSGGGKAADVCTITLDGANIISLDSEYTVDAVLQSLVAFPLRDRPVQIGLMVLNTQTMEPIGLIPQFVGFIDNVPLDRQVKDTPVMMIKCASLRAYAKRRVARTYSDTDHTSRFPGDRAARWISSVVFRRGKYPWNETEASAPSSGGGGGFFSNVIDTYDSIYRR